ncbi:MAG: AAA family ATPase [Verrucomicrobiota bacterium]
MKTWTDITRADDEQILAWVEAQPWVTDMAACQQDSQWHAEGDVWTHTKMVCEALTQLAEWPDLPRTEQLILLFTALFHDAGKPATTSPDPETGRLRSPRHSLVGAEMVRNALRTLNCDLATREHIAALVRFHGRPAHLLEKPAPEREVISLSWLLNNRLLYLFALADTRGRTAKETTRPEDTLHLWKLVAQEQRCLDAPYPFANDQARFLFYRDALSSLHYVPHEHYRCAVTLMSGLPGAGKDTWLARHRPALPVVALDQIREEMDIDPDENQGEVVQAARERAREHLRAGRDFALNGTNIVRDTRKKWIDLFSDYDARIEIVYVEPPVEVILRQNKKRTEPVPERIIRKLLDKLEPPGPGECHTLHYA